MVNTGKPSRGCYMCRARRIKCDEGRPGCMRCQKSKRTCPGYRDAFELKLRDESKSTKKKASRKVNEALTISNVVLDHGDSGRGLFANQDLCYPSAQGQTCGLYAKKDSKSSPSTHFSVVSKFTGEVRSPKYDFISAHMTTPIAQQAACYFLANFVLVPDASTSRGYLDWVMPLLKQESPPKCLLLAFSAVSMAAFGTRPNSKSVLPKAGLSYLNALKEINFALKDPQAAPTDSTLASVMLMASFEQLAPSRMETQGWGSHIGGSVAVIKARGKNIGASEVSRELFIAVRAHMTLNCVALAKPADPGIDWMNIIADDKIVHGFASANLKMASLRADTESTIPLRLHTAENTERVLKLLRRAEALEQEYITWIKNLPATYHIKTVAWIDGEILDLKNSLVHPGRVDSYRELWAAYYYNIVRACRLYIWTTILRCAAWLGDPLDYRVTPEYTTASRVCRQLVEDVVASVPYCFGWNREKDEAMADKSNFACGVSDDPAVKPLTGIFIMWPLFVAASSDFASPSQRMFLRGRLKNIAESMGITQAMIMFNRVGSKESSYLHPSNYIARERDHMSSRAVPSSSRCGITNEVPKPAREVPPQPSPPVPAPAQEAHWLPRPFSTQGSFFQNAVAMKQSMERYLEGYEMATF